jgi:protein-tyrosine phosphatase
LRARQFESEDFQAFDLIYVMDQSNLKNVLALAQNETEKKKVKLILNEISTADAEVPDPYFGGQSGFEQVYDLLDEATDIIIEKINNNQL